MYRWVILATLASASACEATPAEFVPGSTSGEGGAGGERPEGGTAQGTGGYQGLVPCSLEAPCAAEEYCVFWSYRCGTDGGDGYCSPRPEDCPATTDSYVCACDGKVYQSDCQAAAVGHDLNAVPNTCAPVARRFECGFALCDPATEACLHWVAPSQDWSCEPLPDGCQPADCSCFAQLPGGCGCRMVDGHVMLGCATE